MNSTSPAPNIPFPLSSPWQGIDPFLFTAFHQDDYPAGDENQRPVTGTLGRNIGQDFSGRDGWSMYHGSTIPGFPAHPHRGFETITIATRGLVDHTDSLGAAARYGDGDVQWLTAGNGLSHSEMFPLSNEDSPNPFELFQIWLNLPPESKQVQPEFTMQWAEEIPVWRTDGVSIKIIAGCIDDVQALNSPSNSWAATKVADVAIWLLDAEPGTSLELPAAATPQTRRTIYVFAGNPTINNVPVEQDHGYLQVGEESTMLLAGDTAVRALILQGAPIGAPVFQRGPFVANSAAELQQAFDDYRSTQFGGWPWPSTEEVHPRNEGRFASLVDGTTQRPSASADGAI